MNNKKNPKVSLLTACYNGEQFIDSYAMTLLNQTYQNIEIIFIDDGSTDRSAVKITEYKRLFEKKGMMFSYIYQENRGQAAATNTALRRMRGKYFCLLDIDDFMEPECIEKRVFFLEEHPDCGMVRSKIWKLYANEDKRKVKFCEPDYEEDEIWIFNDLIENRMVLFPIFFLYRKAAFDRAYPVGEIYESRYTQDIQVALPLAYYYKCGLIKEFLGDYLYHNASHSHSRVSALENFDLWSGWEDIWLHTVRSIDMDVAVCEMYCEKIQNRFLQIKQFFLLKAIWDALPAVDSVLKYKNYVIFGAGEEGHVLMQMLKSKNLSIAYYVDNAKEKQGTCIDGIEVISLQDEKLQQLSEMYILISISQYRYEIQEQLRGQGFLLEKEYSFYKSFVFKSLGRTLGWN